MTPEERSTARHHIDKRLRTLQSVDALQRPSRGWIKAIREAMGMTTAQLGKRLGVSQPRAVAIEKAELSKSITLESLERAAQALDCQLAYVLIPRKPLEKLVEERAQALARKRLAAASHSMQLEAQGLNKQDEAEQLKKLIDKIIAQGGSKLWADQ